MNHITRRTRAWLVALPIFLVLACSRDSGAVSGPAVTTVAMARSDYTIGLGATSNIELFAYDENGNSMPLPTGITWTSGDPTLVSVDAGGNVHGVALGGPVAITASIARSTASTRITVRPASVSISPALDSVPRGQSVQLTAAARDASGAEVAAGATTWSVAPASVATISPTGLLTAVATGTFTVTATIYAVNAQLSSGVPSQYDGTWVGTATNSYGRPQAIRFNVRFATVGLFVIPDVPTSCGPQVTVQYSSVLGAAIVNDRFYQLAPSTPGASSFYIVGVFTSPTTVVGSVETITWWSFPCTGGGWSGWTTFASGYNAARQ